jgi:GeoRSP system SPASM domain protein
MYDGLTIFWDLDPSVINEPGMAGRVCDEIARNGVGVLHLTDLHPELSAAGISVLRALDGTGIKTFLTANPSAFKSGRVGSIAGIGLSGLLARIDSTDRLQSHIEDILKAHAGISFAPDDDNVEEIPSVIRTCFERGISSVHFPIPRIQADQAEVFCPDPDCLAELPKMKTFARNDFEIAVHDPILRRAFSLSEPEGGHCCRAANDMLYINGSYDVMPCPAIPVPLGSLYRKPLADILASEKRQKMKDMLSSPPSECVSCRHVELCRGGCRGRSFGIFGIFEKKDPACAH